MSFEHNVFFIGPDGFREHIKTSADDAEDLAARREAVLSVLKEVGATPDTWMSDKATYPKREAGASSKLLKAANKEIEAKQSEPETAEETVDKMEESGFLTSEQAEDVREATGTKKASKLLTAARTAVRKELKAGNDRMAGEEAAGGDPTPAKSADPLKASKLAKYARPEKS